MRIKRASQPLTTGRKPLLSAPPPWVRAVRRDPAARRVITAWRRLTTADRSRRAGPGRDTLVACSGGADSSALVLALAAAVFGAKGEPARIVVAHVMHDLRSPQEAGADRDSTRRLAELVGAKFVEAGVRVKAKGGNLEAAARKARYAALVKLAKREGLPFIATAHHADDQLETMLMALMRGAGPRGLAGVAVSKHMEGRWVPRTLCGVRIVRPMIEAGVERADTERICRVAGWKWAVDATNADETRLRAAVRRRIVPVIKSLRPDATQRACVTAAIMADAELMISARAESLMAMLETDEGGVLVWERDRLRREPKAALGALIGLAASDLGSRKAGRKEQLPGARTPRPDALSYHAVMPAIRAIRDDSTEPRRFEVGGIRIEVLAQAVSISARRGR